MSRKPLSPDGEKMLKITTHVTGSQCRRLERAALRRGCPVAVLVREAIDSHLAELELMSPVLPDIMQVLRSAQQPPPDAGQ